MAIGERIHYFRNLRKMTMKFFGMSIGFTEKQADVRISQYESGKRTPKENVIKDMAMVLDVSPEAINVPNIDNYIGLMHTIFALEDIYGIRIGEIEGELCLRLSKTNNSSYQSMYNMFSAWNHTFKKYKDEQITKEEYDQWRYTYPKALVEETKEDMRAVRNGEKIKNDYPKPRYVEIPNFLNDLEDYDN